MEENKINKPSIKDNWLKVDELCPACGQVTKRATGITKQNMKRLFSFNLKKDWLNTVIIFGVLFLIYSYQSEIRTYSEIMGNPYSYCVDIMGDIRYEGTDDNFSAFKYNFTDKNSILWPIP